MKFKCTTCGKSFGSQLKLKYHMRTHTKNQVVECPVCNKKLSAPKYLKSHMNIHTGHRPFICHICGKSFTSSDSCRSRVRNVHPKDSSGPREKRFKCTFCDHTTFSQHLLRKHVTMRHTEKAHACTECDKHFPFAYMLKDHMRLHTGQSFKCDVCLKEFTDGAYFKKHLAYHTSEKKHQCPNCGKAFHRKGNLTAHMRIHCWEALWVWSMREEIQSR